MPLSLPFYKLSPGGNPTILVPDAALPAGVSRAALARALMDANHLGAEQVGFIRPDADPPHMEMMGGEFCVNACRAAALVFSLLGGLPVTEKDAAGKAVAWSGVITASGLDRPARTNVRALPGGGFAAAVAVPLPQRAAPENLAPGMVLVRLPGIVHLLLDTALYPLPDDWRQAAIDMRLEHGLSEEEAVGVIWHERLERTDSRRIYPAVWVRNTDSLVMESACGSGSLALVLHLCRQDGKTAAVRQTSGHDLVVHLEKGHAWIDGPVALTAEGTAYVNAPSL